MGAVAPREELARWGWGDMHYGSQGQDKSVVVTIAKIDAVLGGDNGPETDRSAAQ